MAPLSNAERQKRYREKLKANNPTKYEEKKRAHLEKVKKNKKKILELSQNEQEKRRDKWRQYSARYYKKQKEVVEVPTNEEDKKIKKLQKKFRQKTRKMQEQISELTSTLQRQIKSNRCMRKQIGRLWKKVETMSQNESTTQCCLLLDTCKHTAQSDVVNPPTNKELSPMKKTEMLLDNLTSVDEADKTKLKEKILELNVLSDSLKMNYMSASRSEKRTFKKVMKNPITQKYKITTNISKSTLGLTGRIRNSGKIIVNRQNKIIKEIHDFYNRDDVTRCTAGKKETKTKNKNKVQRKYLLNSIKELYKKYKEDGGKASYTSLLRHRPFYVLNPKLDNRDTCACIKHANFTYKVLKLYKIGIIKTTNINEIMAEISCDLKSKPCMYGECGMCSTKAYRIETGQLGSVETANVTWLQWCLKKVEYQRKNRDGQVEKCVTKKFKKEVVESGLQELISGFQEEAIVFKKHLFNINHQQNIFKDSKEKLKDDEAVLICDFSENYNCKYSKEIQGMHFGSSRNQITLHTGVVYVKNQKPISFCTLSPINEHNPFSIWAHLLPVINALKCQCPKIKKMHFFSDGPTTQYRQKIIFFLFSNMTKELDFEHCTWNFFESAHGKNAADGIGGAVKRNLDKHVAYGYDIPDAETALEILKKTSKIALHLVTESDIQDLKEFYNIDNIKPLKGTMSVHQIVTTEDESHIKYRDVSCLCGENIRGSCACFDIKDHMLISRTDTVKENRKVTVLSDITLSNQNKKIIGIQNLPLCLKRMNVKTDFISGQSSSQNHGYATSVEDNGVKRIPVSKHTTENKKYAIQSGRKRSSNIRIAKRNNKKVKRRTRSSSMTTTSESGEISVHSDSDLLDAPSDLENDETEPNEKAEVSNKTVDRHTTLQVANNRNTEMTEKMFQKGNGEPKVNEETKQEVCSNNKEDELMQIDNNTDEQQQILNGDLKNNDTRKEEMMDVVETQKLIEISNKKGNEELQKVGKAETDLKNDGVKKDLQSIDKMEPDLPDIDNTEKEVYCIGDNVLVRYFIRNSWKYYVGVIETISEADRLYSISFYKTVVAKEKLKFRKPLRLDKDTVPKALLVKKIKILQISDKPEEYVPFYDEDVVYFK